MRSKALSLLLCAFLSILSEGLHAQGAAEARENFPDAQDKFLKAYMAYQKAEKMELAGNFPDAVLSYKEASQIVERVATIAPTWNPAIVEYRKKRILEAITRLEAKPPTPLTLRPEPDLAAGIAEPRDKSLVAQLAYRKAEKTETSGNFPDALRFYKEASQILEGNATSAPTRNPVMDNEKKRTLEAITRVEAKLAEAARALLNTSLTLQAEPAPATEIADPRDKFLSAYMAYQKGEKMEMAENPPDALRFYKEASQILEGLATNEPSWNPTVVVYRKKRILEAITRVKAKSGTVAPAPLNAAPAPDAEPIGVEELSDGSK